ncbi:hypothetical protein [Thermoplasma volcanium GSS1]|uniref:AB hydrolase-1 domain-containing protein n=1 Tax=Thermoplasma volcanium (strain ATCC 51530 / DSM 4299 / JCM 9571 / NBRC 15438 / GSS1) TaxID=273116 RepID=Q97A05_THEVO|nr:alpha/beta hydrolase [Thermoplasma volcanium]BAB60147.1 hypothetical protein [Thermoplasma volcanium GSS1]
MERKFIKTTFGNLSYLERPGEYPLIFLHGLGGSSNNWLRLDRFLAPRFRLIFFDLLGHGQSDKPKIEYTVEVQAKAIHEAINSLGISRFSIAGNSYGGWVSLYLSIHIAKPDKLILIDSAGINKTVGESGEEMIESFVQKVMGVEDGNDEEVIRNIIRNNAKHEWKIKEEDLKNLSVPTIIIWGTADNILSIDYGRKLHDLIQNSKLYEIPAAKHTPQRTHPQILAKILNENIV